MVLIIFFELVVVVDADVEPNVEADVETDVEADVVPNVEADEEKTKHFFFKHSKISHITRQSTSL